VKWCDHAGRSTDICEDSFHHSEICKSLEFRKIHPFSESLSKWDPFIFLVRILLCSR
jgi:hypothetical protein